MDPVEKKTILEKAEDVEVSQNATGNFGIVTTLYHHGWSNSTSKDWRKNHNLLLIKALATRKRLPYVLSHLENIMLRCSPHQNEITDINLLPDARNGCPVGMLINHA